MALAPKPAVVLEVLRRAGEVLTREELHEEVWGDGVHVDYQQGLDCCIRRVRIALGDEARRPLWPLRAVKPVGPDRGADGFSTTGLTAGAVAG